MGLADTGVRDLPMKVAYLDCFSGISGDMFLGALIDAGLPFEALAKALESLPLEGYRLERGEVERNHLHGTRLRIHVETERQTQRNLLDIREVITRGAMSPFVKTKSLQVFEALARVEGEIHSLPMEAVHFHEVGAVDSILDIVGTVYGVERLGIETLTCSPLPLGTGFVESAHGRLPLPAPATAALLKGVPVFDSGLRHETVTPTGAALVKGLASAFGEMPPMVIRTIGYGAGEAELRDRPNLLRILIGDVSRDERTETVAVLETNLDDAPPEWLGHLMGLLLEAGALDVVYFPVLMKKNRPGVQVQVVAAVQDRDALTDILFRETTTLGVRVQTTQRKILERSSSEVESPWGKLRVKVVVQPDGRRLLVPEYEACRDMALTCGRPLKELYYWVMGLNQP